LINDIEGAEISMKVQLRLTKLLDEAGANYLIIPNDGRSYASSLNAARNSLQSNFIAILNSDDLSTPQRLLSQVCALEDSGAQLAIGKLVKFQGIFRLPSISGDLSPTNFGIHHLLLGAYGCDASIVVTREAWLEFMEFDESAHNADWATALKVYSHLDIIGVDNAFYRYRMHSHQVTQNQMYNSDDFPLYYPLWHQLSASLGLPQVSINVARALSRPWVAQKLTKSEFEMMQLWCAKMVNATFSTSGKKQTKSILDRRLIISGSIAFGITNKPLLLVKIIFEFLFIRITGSQVRSIRLLRDTSS